MKRQRGNELLIAGGAVLALVAIVGAAAWFLQVRENKAYAAGHKAALLEVAQRDNENLQAAQKRIRELEAEKAELEEQHRSRMAEIDKDHDKEVRDVQATKDRVIACLRDDACRLRYLGRSADARCAAGDRGAAAGAPGAAGERDAAAPGEPARAVVGQEDQGVDDDVFTAQLLAEGDEAIADLTACQAIVRDDRLLLQDQVNVNRGGTMR